MSQSSPTLLESRVTGLEHLEMPTLRRSRAGRLRRPFLQDQARRRENDFAIGNDGHGGHSVAAVRCSRLSRQSASRSSLSANGRGMTAPAMLDQHQLIADLEAEIDDLRTALSAAARSTWVRKPRWASALRCCS